MEELIEKTVPAGIRHREELKLDQPLSELMSQYLLGYREHNSLRNSNIPLYHVHAITKKSKRFPEKCPLL